MTEFLDNIARLTTGEPRKIIRDDGTVTRHHIDGLLQQLQEAVAQPAMREPGGTAEKARLPLDAAAMDLVAVISREAAEALVAVTGRHVPIGTPADYVNAWAARAQPWDELTIQGEDYTADSLARRWVRLVEGFFNPDIHVGIPAACPVEECGARYTAEGGGDAAMVIRLTRDPRRIVDIKCRVCRSLWSPEQLVPLALALGFEPDFDEIERITEEGSRAG